LVGHVTEPLLFLLETLVDTHREHDNKQQDENHGKYDEDFSLVELSVVEAEVDFFVFVSDGDESLI
jgi:hypothetical protein